MNPRYRVTVDTEWGSEWDLIPMGFSTHWDALRHATGIAKAWEGQAGAPAILITENGAEQRWSVEALVCIGYLLEWFDP